MSASPGPVRADVAGFRLVRDCTEALAEPLTPEDQTAQSMPDVSPTKWHRAHTSWFFEEFVLQPHAEGDVVFHPDFGYLFNSYYEAVGARHPRHERGLITRPGAAEVGAYRRHVDARMEELLARGPDPVVTGLVELGLHHEQQHQELLLMDAKHVLSRNPLDPVYRQGVGTVASPVVERKLDWLDHDGGLVDIGHQGTGFAFDNEAPRHTVHLRPFRLADRAVTCGEWLQFMADGGYRRAELWLSDGWATVNTQHWDSPLYWSQDGDDWTVFTLHGRRPVDPSEPVCHVSYYEADAYAHWSGFRLPTEAEWEAVAAARPLEGHFLGAGALHPRAAEADATQLFGDVWEWTSSSYTAYPGFRTAPGAVGEYNGKFMVNQQVLRGGACVTPDGQVRPTYRNFFPAPSRWAFSGVRLAADVD